MGAEAKPSPGAGEREIFLGALDHSVPAERTAFLDAACAGDRALRARVAELLAEPVGDFLETPAASSPASTLRLENPALTAGLTEKPGDRIGRYKLLQKIGEGGCGVVYMAEQEEPVRRRVALKVIKLGMDTRSVIARFEAERQALAMMDHPNIARVFDAGATDAGRPFFVMELVRGVRITEYCNENNLPTEERLKLFIQVCQAIQHAHQKGVIHRDIKPSNILVTLHDGVPVPKVIDFGIAKATEQPLTEKTLFTEFQSFIGTPAYMSPEQAEMSGLDIDTRSDIYALGVLLYELLIGQTPFDAEALFRTGLDEFRRTIREQEPVRPSSRLAAMRDDERTRTAQHRRTAAPELIHRLRGDLDWIAMKCLEKDRTRRYAAANDLAMDVQNYLEDEPVIARPPSNVYRLQKLLRRHRRAFAAAAAVAAALIVGAGISLWQAVRATTAEHTAQTSQKKESQLRQQAERDKNSARLNEYVADINLAQQSLAAGNFGRAVQLLEKHQPAAGAPDLRGFEWRHLWHLSRGDAHIALPAQDGSVQSLAISPSGDLLAIGLRDSFRIWNLRTRTVVTTQPRGVTSMLFLKDGKQLVTTSLFTTRFWNTTDGKEEWTWPDQSGPLVLSPDGASLATVSRDGVHVWNTTDWNELCLLNGASGPVAFSPDGKRMVTDTRSTGLTVWSLATARPEVVLRDSTNLFSRPGPQFRGDRLVAFSPDGQRVVAARNTLSARGVFVLSIWDARAGEEEAAMPADAEHIEHAAMITSLAFSPDGNTLATASADYSVRLWDFAKRQPRAVLQGHLSEVWSLDFLPDGQTLVSGSRDGEIKLWPAQPQRREDILTGVRHPLAFSKDGRRLAVLTRDWSAAVFLNPVTGEREPPFDLETRRGRPGPAVLSADFRTLAQGLDDGTVKLWNTETRAVTTLKVSESGAEILALAPEGQALFTRGRDGILRRWDLPGGTSTVWRADVARMLSSPDGRMLVTVGRGSVVQLWDAATLAPLAKLESEELPVSGFGGFTAAFSADSRLLAVAYQDDTIRLWETATGQLLGVCTGHKQGVRSVAISPDAKTLASASDDSTVKFWNIATQQELLTIRQLGAPLTGLLFSPDGQMLVGGSGVFSQTGGLRFFRAPSVAGSQATNAPPARSAKIP